MGLAGILKQSTAVDVLIGPFVDSTDGDAEETGLTIAQADVRLSKNGQTAAAKNDATTAAHDADGFYNCELDATDTNTVGQLTLYVHVAGALAVRHDFQIVEEAVYDQLFAASAPGAASTTALQTVDDNVDAILTDTGTTLQAELDGIQADTEDIQSRLPAALISGKISATHSLETGTAQAGAAGSITLESGASSIDNFYRFALLAITSGTGAGQSRMVVGYTGSSKVATVGNNWYVNPDATSVYTILPWGSVDVRSWRGGTPNALVSGRMDSSVGAMATNSLTAAALAADAVSEIGDEVAAELATYDGPTAAELTAEINDVQTDIAALTDIDAAGVRTALGMSAANLDTQLSDIDTVVDAIKAKTDNLPGSIPKNVALANFAFLLVDATDFATPETGVTPSVEISKDGGAFAAATNAATEIGNGLYKISFTQAEMNADIIIIKVTGTGCAQSTQVLKTDA